MDINDILIDSITYKRESTTFLGQPKREFITGVHVTATYKSIELNADISTTQELTPQEIKEELKKLIDSEE